MNAHADDDQGDDGDPEDPGAAFAAWKAGRADLAKLANDTEAIKAAHRRLSPLGIVVASNPFKAPAPRAVVAELENGDDDDGARKRRAAALNTDWRKWLPKRKAINDE